MRLPVCCALKCLQFLLVTLWLKMVQYPYRNKYLQRVERKKWNIKKGLESYFSERVWQLVWWWNASKK